MYQDVGKQRDWLGKRSVEVEPAFLKNASACAFNFPHQFLLPADTYLGKKQAFRQVLPTACG